MHGHFNIKFGEEAVMDCIWYFRFRSVATEDKHNRTDNVSVNVIPRRVRVTTVVVEKL